MAISLILNIPHASIVIPQRDLNVFEPICSLTADRERKIEQLQEELLAMTDWYTDELFDHGLGRAIIAPVSRLVCDMERFSHDEEEPMMAVGMGYCYTHGSQRQLLKKFPASYKDEVLWRYYAPYHVALMDAVEEEKKEKSVLILDCHSFSPVPLPYEMEQSLSRPDICIGTDSYHTPLLLRNLVRQFFQERGYRTEMNTPYSGTVVPFRDYHTSEVYSIMIEVNRGLYLKPGTSEKNEHFQEIKRLLYDLEVMLLHTNL